MLIIMMGMKHCGKSTHGQVLAEYLNCPFYDSDDVLEELYFQKFGKKLKARQIYIEYGKNFFRSLEKKGLEKIISELSNSKYKNVVSALGGGSLEDQKNISILKKANPLFFYIKVDPEILYNRVVQKGRAAFLSKTDPKKSFMDIHAERNKIFTELADITIEPEDKAINIVSSLIIDKIQKFQKEGI